MTSEDKAQATALKVQAKAKNDSWTAGAKDKAKAWTLDTNIKMMDGEKVNNQQGQNEYLEPKARLNNNLQKTAKHIATKHFGYKLFNNSTLFQKNCNVTPKFKVITGTKWSQVQPCTT